MCMTLQNDNKSPVSDHLEEFVTFKLRSSIIDKFDVIGFKIYF